LPLTPSLRTSGALLLASCLCRVAPADVVIAYEAAARDDPTDVDILARLLKPDGTLGWNADEPLSVADSKDIETSPVVVADGAGGAFVIYEYRFAEGEHEGDTDIVAQHIGTDGTLLWNDGEKPTAIASSKARESHPVAVGDGAGGFIVAYEWTDEDGDTDILAQRVSAAGDLLWMKDDTPAVVAASPGIERNPVVVPDGKGGATIVFEWGNADGAADVMAQRVAPDGQVLWNDGEQAIDVSASPNSERAPVAVPDGHGGAIVAFEFEFLEGEFKGDVDIMAQRIDADGVLLWNGGQEPSQLAGGKGIERRPSAIPDGAGGMIAAFEYEPLEGEFAGDIDVLAARIDADGKLLWNDGERSASVSTAPGLERSVQMVPLPEAQAIVVVEHEFRNGENAGDIDILAQRVAGDGTLLWNGGEKSTMLSGAKWLERSPLALPDGVGGAIVVCTATGAEGEFEGDQDVWAVRVSGQGELLWKGGEQSVEVAGSDLLERRPSAAVVN
jgi:hypothetical protein